MPRSGTTFLHRLLSLDPDHRGLTFAEIMRPFPSRASSQDREILERTLSIFAAQLPELEKKHSLTSTEAEECGVLLDPSMVTPNFGIFADTGSYEVFRRSQDPRVPYQVYRELLGQIEAADPRRLVLKAPVHLGAVGTLLETWPNLKIIVLERDPVTSLTSLFSLVKSFWNYCTEGVDEARLVHGLIEAQSYAVERFRTAEPHLPPQQWIRVGFADLVGDPSGTLRRIYTHFGEELPPERVATFEQIGNLARKQRPGEHNYALPEGGPSAEEIRATFPGWGPGS